MQKNKQIFRCKKCLYPNTKPDLHFNKAGVCGACIHNEYNKKIICGEINIPVLVNGGCGSPEHMIKPFTFGVDGVCAGSIFYFSQYSYKDIKDFLIKNKINVRPF